MNMEQQAAQQVLLLLQQKSQLLATAESCTGGLVGASLTAIPGCSASYRGGFIAYHDDVKHSLLGISQNVLQSEGAVSEAVARLMAESCRTRLQCDWGISTTGYAGPEGGDSENPVGTVWMAIAGPQGTQALKKIFCGTRNQIQEQAVLFLMNSLHKSIETVQNITCSFEQ